MNVEIKNLNYLAISNLLVQLKADNDEIKNKSTHTKAIQLNMNL